MLRLLALVLVAAAAVSGCNRAHAKTPAAPPALLTPAPPDRLIVPATVPEPEPPPAQPAPQPAAPPRSEAPASRPARPAPPAAASPVPTAAAPETPPSPPPVLQTTANPSEVEQRARALMEAARSDLAKINPAQLPSNARAQYDTALAFVRQAENALKVKNVVLARELADKAAALASQLRR